MKDILYSSDKDDQNCFQKLFFSGIYSLMKKAQYQPLEEEMIGQLPDDQQSLSQHKEFLAFKNTVRQKNQMLYVQLLCFFSCNSIVTVSSLAEGFLYIVSYDDKFIEHSIINQMLIRIHKLREQEFLRGHISYFLHFGYAISQFNNIDPFKVINRKYLLLINQKVAGYDAMTVLSLEVMRKCLRISLLSNTNRTIGELTNLMQVDIQKIILASNNLVNLAMIPLQLIISLYYIYNQIGVSVMVSVVIIILSLVQHKYLGRQIISAQSLVLKAKDKRAKYISEAFQQIKFIKINALEEIFMNMIKQLRQEEIRCVENRLQFYAFSIFSGWLSPQLILSLTFGLYEYLGNDLVSSKVFPIISLISMLATSLSLLPVSINALLETKLSLKRIQQLLDTDELMSDCIEQFEYQNPKIAVQIDDGNFYWKQNENKSLAILKNINLSIAPRTFISIIGDVGSGKSSLFLSLLGEMIFQQGIQTPKITLYGTIAYVGQKSWIQSGTVKENITFGKPFHQKYYDMAIYYSCLNQDLGILINGDETIIGEKGINLSGGQKARINLARAIYSEADIFLFDDPLSAVDAHVGNFIMKECLLGHLKDKTRILITHALNYCKFTDYIYLLQNGEVIGEGNYSTMMNNNIFQQIEAKFHVTSDRKDYDCQQNKQTRKTQEKIINLPIEQISQNDQKKQQNSLNQIEELILREERQVGQIQTEVFTKYFTYSGDCFNYCLLTFVLIMWVVSQLASTLWIAEWSTKSTEQKFSKTTFFLIYFIIGLIQSSFAYIRAALTIKSSMKSSSQIHDEIIKCLFQAPLCQFFERVPLGRIMNRLTKDIGQLDIDIIMNISLFSTKFSQVVSNTLLMIITSTYLIIFPFLVFLYLSGQIQRLYMKASRELQRLELISKSPILSYFTESLSGLTTIRGYQQGSTFLNNFAQKLDNNKQIVYQLTEANCWFIQILGFSSLIVNMTAVAYCILYTQNPAFAGLILTYVSCLDANVQQTIDSISLLEHNMISFERCIEYTKIPPERRDMNRIVDEAWPQRGKIQIQHLSVKYRENLPSALQDLTLQINEKEKIGVVGRTGAGKSSITLSLLRILEAFEGRILIDGIDISTLSLKQLRQQITTILQDAVIFNGTIRENLDPFKKCSDHEIQKIIEDCCLTKLLNDRNGLDTMINEGGDNLSAGEKQLICIARAILKKNKIVLIDEATANIDIETEEKIQKTIVSTFQNCTVITIAHRINTILHCDKILVIDQGQLKEFGNRKDLMNDTSSLFYQIYQEALQQASK